MDSFQDLGRTNVNIAALAKGHGIHMHATINRRLQSRRRRTTRACSLHRSVRLHRWPPDGGDPGVPQARLGLLNYEPTHAPGAFDLDHVGGVRAITPHESEHHVGMLWACRATIWTHRSIERDDEAGNGEERVHADEAAGAGYADQDGKASRSEARLLASRRSLELYAGCRSCGTASVFFGADEEVGSS